MVIILLMPVFVSFLLLIGHFLRTGSIYFAVLSFIFPFFLIIKRVWSARFVQLFLLLGAVEWAITLLNIVTRRLEDRQPWGRLVIILGAVIIFTGGSALVFSLSHLIRKRYGLSTKAGKKVDM